MRRVPLVLLTSIALAAAVTACGGAPPPPAAPPPPPEPPTPAGPTTESIDAGNACVKADATCGGGACNVAVKNNCGEAVHCELDVTATCEAQGGAGEQSGGRERQSFAAGESGDVGAKATCPGGNVLRTEVSKFVCK